MGSTSTNVLATVVLAGPRAQEVVEAFKSVAGMTHASAGMFGQVHLAVQDVTLSTGDLTIARVAAEHRQDMHRLLHHTLQPLEAQLGTAPYGRLIHASSTMPISHEAFETRPFGGKQHVTLTTDAAWRRSDMSQKMHVQHTAAPSHSGARA